jgi:drug/metabolite transporter (DMT)-like permease
MSTNHTSRKIAVLQALLVTFLWSTSWVLIKIGLEEMPALSFAGLRYSLAFAILLPFTLRGEGLASIRKLKSAKWLQLLALGVVYYGITQGAQFMALVYLPAVTVSLMLNFTPIIAAMLGVALLSERPAPWQWLGIILTVGGAVVYFSPGRPEFTHVLGLTIAAIGLLANAASSVMGRQINRTRMLSPITITVISMGFGSFLLLVSAVVSEGLPRFSLENWAIIVVLAVVNTAFAFTLWNHTLRTLSAVESSAINNTMLIQIATLAWLLLGESLTATEIAGLVVAAVGVLTVQLSRSIKR